MSVSDSQSTYTQDSMNTEKLLNCSYPFNFLMNILEHKVQEKKYSIEKIFLFIEEYLDINLKNTLNTIKDNDCYKERYDIVLTSIFCLCFFFVNK